MTRLNGQSTGLLEIDKRSFPPSCSPSSESEYRWRDRTIDTPDGLLMIDRVQSGSSGSLSLSQSYIRIRRNDSRSRVRAIHGWVGARSRPQSYRELIIGREPTIVVISGLPAPGNSDVWHATVRRSWEAPHSISHSVTRITSHLPINLPLGVSSLSLSLSLSLSASVSLFLPFQLPNDPRKSSRLGTVPVLRLHGELVI